MKKYFFLIYYSIYKLLWKSAMFNPILYTYKLSFAKRYFARKGYDPKVKYMDAMNDFFVPVFAGALMAICFGLIINGLLSFLCGIFKINIDYEYQLTFSFIFSFIFFYFYVWVNDKEVKKAFKKFDKTPRVKKILWTFITLIFIVIAVFVWWKGMTFWGKTMKL